MKRPVLRWERRAGAWVLLVLFVFTILYPRNAYGAEQSEGLTSENSQELPESMSLFSEELILKLSEDTGRIKPQFFPEGTKASVSYYSEDESIAVVEEDGSVIPLKEGSTNIEVKTPEGLEASCKVTVTADNTGESQIDQEIGETGTRVQSSSAPEAETDLKNVTDEEGTSQKDSQEEEKPSQKEVRNYLQLSRSYGFDGPVMSSVYAKEQTTAESLNPDISTVLAAVRAYMLKHDTDPDFSSCWNVIGMTRSGLDVPQTYIDTFYKNVIAYLEEKNWEITRTKYSDYSKLIIALTSIGKDAQDIMGHNLFYYLSDFANVKRQGFNGPIWALIALHSHPSYDIPQNAQASEQVTEEGLVQYILKGETAKGGWTLSGTEPDSDMTGMAIQALAPYYGIRSDVTEAIDRALSWLSSTQYTTTGGFGTLNSGKLTETSESACQVIVALSALGIDGSKDSRFIKNGKWPMTGLFQYYLPEGGFMHVAAGADNNGGGEAGTLNGMSTEQGMYATVAYKRLLESQPSLYNMKDIVLKKGERPEGLPEATTKTESTTASKNVKVIRVALNYSSITVTKGRSKTLKATVTPSNATNKKLKWTSSNKKIATVSSKGKVTGKKAGTAKITVTAEDGSKKKAVCTVKVKEAATTAKRKTTKATTRSQTKTVSTTATRKVSQQQASVMKAGTTTAASGAAGSTAASKKGTETTTATGWNFEGGEYVPESDTNSEEEMTESTDEGENSEDSSKKDESTGPLPYVMMGGGGIGIAGVFWWLYRNGAIDFRQGHKTKEKDSEEREKL